MAQLSVLAQKSLYSANPKTDKRVVAKRFFLAVVEAVFKGNSMVSWQENKSEIEVTFAHEELFDDCPITLHDTWKLPVENDAVYLGEPHYHVSDGGRSVTVSWSKEGNKGAIFERLGIAGTQKVTLRQPLVQLPIPDWIVRKKEEHNVTVVWYTRGEAMRQLRKYCRNAREFLVALPNG